MQVRSTQAHGAEALRERLRAGPSLLLDGALGTELERRGVAATLPLWSTHALLRDPALVAEVHADYVAAGAEILTANTFRTQRRVLARDGIGGRARELTALAVGLARRAAEARPGRVFVVGSAPPLEDCYEPERVPDAAALADEHALHAAHLAAAGVDGILIETMNTIREAVAATLAARAHGLPCLVSFVCKAAEPYPWTGRRSHRAASASGARSEPQASGVASSRRAESHRAGERSRIEQASAALLSGEPLGAALAAAAAAGADAVLVNCLTVSSVPASLPALCAAGPPWGVYANLGTPGVSEGPGSAEPYPPEAFAEHAARWLAAGARIVGGCCGTTPAHIAAIRRRLAARA
jgi:S-methylmethionine-dependent homocysteine/selenocysteine methylase